MIGGGRAEIGRSSEVSIVNVSVAFGGPVRNL
jgi:hypothetical protein